MKTILISLVLVGLFAMSAAAQLPSFDVSKIPAAGSKPADLVPVGWKVEDAAKGDLNGDGVADYAIKVIEDRKGEDKATDGDRHLIVAFGEGGGLKRVAVGQKILQCLECGGAFYGVMPAPAGVTIEKGVLTIENEHGSRNVSSSTFKFKYSRSSGKLELIGYDFRDSDRLNGETTVESSNYITGTRVTSRGKRSMTTRRARFNPARISLEDADYTAIEAQALHRLGLD